MQENLRTRFAALRKGLRLTQAETAAAIGVSLSQYSMFEIGRRRLSAEKIEKLGTFLRDKGHVAIATGAAVVAA